MPLKKLKDDHRVSVLEGTPSTSALNTLFLSYPMHDSKNRQLHFSGDMVGQCKQHQQSFRAVFGELEYSHYCVKKTECNSLQFFKPTRIRIRHIADMLGSAADFFTVYE